MRAPDSTSPRAVAGETTAHDRVAAFLATTTELPDDADLETELVGTDGVRTWDRDDLDQVTAAHDTDPTWLRLRAAINTYQSPRP